MAYKLTKIEPVAFGEKEIEPELDAEKKLRLGRIQYTGGADAEKKQTRSSHHASQMMKHSCWNISQNAQRQLRAV
jgi:hypothetical protein